VIGDEAAAEESGLLRSMQTGEIGPGWHCMC
jgi:hypothetical protein